MKKTKHYIFNVYFAGELFEEVTGGVWDQSTRAGIQAIATVEGFALELPPNLADGEGNRDFS